MDTQVLKQSKFISLLRAEGAHARPALGSAARTRGTFAINTPGAPVGDFLPKTSLELLPSLLPKRAMSSCPSIPHTQSPGAGNPGGTAPDPEPGAGCKGTHRHRESQEQPQSPPSPLFPKFLGAVGQSLDVTRSSLFPPTTESKLHRFRRLPGGQGLGSSGSSSWGRFQKSSG